MCPLRLRLAFGGLRGSVQQGKCGEADTPSSGWSSVPSWQELLFCLPISKFCVILIFPHPHSVIKPCLKCRNVEPTTDISIFSPTRVEKHLLCASVRQSQTQKQSNLLCSSKLDYMGNSNGAVQKIFWNYKYRLFLYETISIWIHTWAWFPMPSLHHIIKKRLEEFYITERVLWKVISVPLGPKRPGGWSPCGRG